VLAFGLLLSSVRVARAGTSEPAASPPAASVSEESDPQETRKIVGVSLLGLGLVAAATGTVMALRYDHAIGGCDAQGVCTQEDGRVPLGIGVAMVGVSMAFVGTLLWLQAPRASRRLAFTSSGIGVRF
jgi:hypothetical protein